MGLPDQVEHGRGTTVLFDFSRIGRGVNECGELLVCHRRRIYPERLRFYPMDWDLTIGRIPLTKAVSHQK